MQIKCSFDCIFGSPFASAGTLLSRCKFLCIKILGFFVAKFRPNGATLAFLLSQLDNNQVTHLLQQPAANADYEGDGRHENSDYSQDSASTVVS